MENEGFLNTSKTDNKLSFVNDAKKRKHKNYEKVLLRKLTFFKIRGG